MAEVQDIALNLNGFEKNKAGRAVLNYGQISTNLNSEQFFRLPLTAAALRWQGIEKQKIIMSTQVDLFTTVEPTSVSPAIAKPFVMCSAVDNMELLLSQPNESVNMIYSDILYGTGRNFGEYQDLKAIRSGIESHYLPRLIEMKRVLKQNGCIYLQMDWRIVHWVRCLMDDVFGVRNFIALIPFRKKTMPFGTNYIEQLPPVNPTSGTRIGYFTTDDNLLPFRTDTPNILY